MADGLAELLRIADDLRDNAARAPHRAGVAVGEAAHRIVTDAKTNAPFKTGHHKSSITASMVSQTAAELGPTSLYGGFLEFGTSRMSPRPHILPAADRGIPPLLAALERIDLL